MFTLIVAGIWICWWAFTYVVTFYPALVVGGINNAYYTLRALFHSIKSNINPYATYVDKSKNAQPARRGYFYGPGLHQFKAIIKDYVEFFQKKREDVHLSIDDGEDIVFISRILRSFGVVRWLTVVAGTYTSQVFGIGFFCALYLFAFAIAMATHGLITGIAFVLDFLYLKLLKVSAACDYCKQEYAIPTYECPECHAWHTRLRPGAYGAWHRKCTCGQSLPTTFLNNRGSLQAYCPHCGNSISASEVKHLPISIIGPTSAGKTVLLSAFFHELFEAINRSGDALEHEIPEKCKDMFDDMERWFNGAPCDPTAFTDTATTYSVLLNAAQFRARKRLSVYDIAGESFRDPALTGMIPQMQFKYSNGFVLIIDPLNADLMRSEAESNGDDITNYSEMDVAAVIMNFVTYMKTNLSRMALSKMIQTPISVVITKTDLPSIKKRISYVHIRHEVKSGAFPDFASARDELCRKFLDDIGLSEAIQAIEANFSNVHYYPVSAIGHEMNGEAYEPEHVFEPFANIISIADPALAGILKLQ